MSKNWAGGHDSHSYRARNLVMKRNEIENNGRCQLGIEGKCTFIATQAHHTLGKAVTGNDIRYMIAVCMPCNNAIGDPTKHKEPPSHVAGLWD